VALSNVTTNRKVDAASSAQSTIVAARQGTRAAGTSTSLYKEGNTNGKLVDMPTVTGSLGQKPDTVRAAANTTIKGSIPSMGVTDAIVICNDAGLSIRQTMVQKAAGAPLRVAAGRPRYTKKIALLAKVPGTKDSKSGRSTYARLIKTQVNGATAGMEQLNGLPIEGKQFLIEMGISTASVFLATEVGELAKKYQVWHNQMAEQNPRSSRPVSLLIKGSARIYLTQMRTSLRESLKVEKSKGVGQQGDPRQGRTWMAKDMDPHNKGNPTKKVQAGNMVVKDPRSTASGFSLKPELKISSAAVEAEKHNPKVTGKKECRGTQEQGGEQEGGILKNMKSTPEAMGKFLDHQGTDHYNPKKYESQDQLRASTPEAMVKIGPLEISYQSYSEFFHNLHDGDDFAVELVTMGGTVERPIEIHTAALVLDVFLTHAPFAVSLQDAMAVILERSQVETLSAPTEWATFINPGNVDVMIEADMEEFAADTTLEVRRKTQLDDEVSSGAPWMEVQTDETRMLRE
jgi:hypothetical protein